MREESGRAKRVAEGLRALYPDASCTLSFRTPFELLVATILSARCRDERVNQVTPALFGRWPGPGELAEAEPQELEEIVRPTGFFRNKARFLRQVSRLIAERHGGAVPGTMEELLRLPGVARKTANVVLGTGLGIQEGFVVDTHVARLSRRLGLTAHRRSEAIEADLMARFPRREWTALGHRLIRHGRAICTARVPRCGGCLLMSDCPRIGLGQERPAAGPVFGRERAREGAVRPEAQERER